MNAFKTPKTTFGNCDAETAASLIAAASDIALVVDDAGVIQDVAFQSDDLASGLDHHTWVGKTWASVVTVESRSKVESMLRNAVAKAEPRWRHLNHPSPRGADVPVLYSAVPMDPTGPQSARVVVFGRDLRAVSDLQQRLVDAQQSLERDYSKLRHVEMRYRLLFQISSEAMLVLDAETSAVTEANPAARTLLGPRSARVVHHPLTDVFDPASHTALQALLTTVRAAGRADDVRARLADDGPEVIVAAAIFREEATMLFLVRLMPADGAPAPSMSRTDTKLLKLVESAPDGFVVADTDLRILSANAAFLDMAQLATEEQARGESLDRWLGRQGVDLDVLTSNLRQRGSIRLYATVVRGEYGVSTDVEISAVAVMNGGQPCFGFAIRGVARRLAPDIRAARELPRSIEQLTELIGRVSMKDLVRETTDVIEKLCIEAALELTGDNRASAAEMLGLSRQSFYVKMRRYGLGDLENAE